MEIADVANELADWLRGGKGVIWFCYHFAFTLNLSGFL